jgi:serine/threonine protein kinase
MGEVGNMKKLNHPNVMKVLDKVKDTGGTIHGKQEEEEDDKNNQVWDWVSQGIWKAHIVFELATGGDLFSYQESQGKLSEDETKFMAYQLVLGLNHLHSSDVAHRGMLINPPPSSHSTTIPTTG